MLYNYTRGRFLENRRESDKVRNAVISVLKEKGLIVRIARIKVVTGKLSRDEFVSRI